MHMRYRKVINGERARYMSACDLLHKIIKACYVTNFKDLGLSLASGQENRGGGHLTENSRVKLVH